MKHVAIYASGSGTNAERVIAELNGSAVARVVLVITNNQNAGVIARAKNAGVQVEIIEKSGTDVTIQQDILRKHSVDIVLLLGYLRLLPAEIIEAYVGHIVNLHPALLPKYGGKGMYGRNVHEAVSKSDDTVSGVSLHRVNNKYDDGEVLYQELVHLPENATPEQIESLVRETEQRTIAPAIKQLIESNTI